MILRQAQDDKNLKLAYHHKDLRKALVEEALALLAEGGSAGVTLRELARRLGVTHTAPYAHYADKKALLLDVADAGFEKLANACAAARASESDPVRAFGKMGYAYITFAREHPHLYRLMFADPELADDPECELSASGDRALQTLIDAIVALNPPPNIDLQDLAAGIWSLSHGISMLEIDRRISKKTLKSAEDVMELMSGLVIRALR